MYIKLLWYFFCPSPCSNLQPVATRLQSWINPYLRSKNSTKAVKWQVSRANFIFHLRHCLSRHHSSTLNIFLPADSKGQEEFFPVVRSSIKWWKFLEEIRNILTWKRREWTRRVNDNANGVIVGDRSQQLLKNFPKLRWPWKCVDYKIINMVFTICKLSKE